jgi:hypothetical protein
MFRAKLKRCLKFDFMILFDVFTAYFLSILVLFSSFPITWCCCYDHFAFFSSTYQGLFLGSVGAANNKNALKSFNITHVLTVASTLLPAHPNDFVYKVINGMKVFLFGPLFKSSSIYKYILLFSLFLYLMFLL